MFLDESHLEVFSGKELDSHDGKDEPEDETDEQHIEDTWDSLHQGIYYNLENMNWTNIMMLGKMLVPIYVKTCATTQKNWWPSNQSF